MFNPFAHKSLEDLRWDMVEMQIELRGIKNPLVLEAMRRIERHRFVPGYYQEEAYGDYPLPIGAGQTISQPYIVALMTELLDPRPNDRVLEIGTGSGYQTAILAETVADVYSIEIVEELSQQAARILDEIGYSNIHLRMGDATEGWPEEAPFDKIISGAAPEVVPTTLFEQLKPGGRMVIPVGTADQQLMVYKKEPDGQIQIEPGIWVRFVPMIHRNQNEYREREAS